MIKFRNIAFSSFVEIKDEPMTHTHTHTHTHSIGDFTNYVDIIEWMIFCVK